MNVYDYSIDCTLRLKPFMLVFHLLKHKRKTLISGDLVQSISQQTCKATLETVM